MATRDETLLNAVHRLRADISDITTYMVSLDAHITRLGGTQPKESTDIPAFKAILTKLDDMDDKLKSAGCTITKRG